MGKRIRALALLVVLLGTGVLLGSALSQWWGPLAPVAPPSAVPRAAGRVRVEVLNTGGVPGVARTATRALRDQGFDVVFFGNAESFTGDSSVVMDRVGELRTARDVADVLGIRDVRSLPDSNLFVDVSVRLGPEWAPANRSEVPQAPWWDPRTLLRRIRGSSPPQP